MKPPVFALLALNLLGAADAPAQVAGEDAGVPAEAETLAADPAYSLPDLPDGMLVYQGERFQILPIVAIVGDYTFFDQDEASLAQVGRQEDTQDLRAARFGVALRSRSERGWSMFFAVDYQERRTREDDAFRLYDLRLRIPVGKVNIDIGKQKQPFVFEMAGLSILNPQQERILSPFFVTRSIGVRASGQMAGDRMTWSAGWFNDWLESGASFSDNADDWVARITGLASVSADNRDYLHLGLGLRRVGPDIRRIGRDIGVVRLRGRPESNVSDYYVDTGEFEADYVGELGVELIWNRGPFMFAAEHIAARAEAPASRNPRFSGSYAMLSWVVTGESRPYLRATGSTGAVTPASGLGAVELVARWSHLDLDGGLVGGGELDKWHFGVNWWVSRQWKLGLSWGEAYLDRFGVNGNTTMLLTRLQWYVP